MRAVKACNVEQVRKQIGRLHPGGVRTARRRLPLLNFAFLDGNKTDKEVKACVKLLVAHKADVNLKFEDVLDGEGERTVLREALLRDSPALLKWLFAKRNADFNILQCRRHILSVAVEFKCYRAAMWMVCTTGVLDPVALQACYHEDAVLQSFVHAPLPQYGVLQNIVVELVCRSARARNAVSESQRWHPAWTRCQQHIQPARSLPFLRPL